MQTLRDTLGHTLVVLAAIGAVAYLCAVGRMSGEAAVVVIAGAAGVTTGAAASSSAAKTAIRALTTPPPGIVATTAVDGPVGATSDV